MSGKFTKRAWIRDASVPMGQPAKGRINCPCGQAPESTFGQSENINCPCGRVYDGHGWVVKDIPQG